MIKNPKVGMIVKIIKRPEFTTFHVGTIGIIIAINTGHNNNKIIVADGTDYWYYNNADVSLSKGKKMPNHNLKLKKHNVTKPKSA